MWLVSASYFSGHVSVDVSTVLPKKKVDMINFYYVSSNILF